MGVSFRPRFPLPHLADCANAKMELVALVFLSRAVLLLKRTRNSALLRGAVGNNQINRICLWALLIWNRAWPEGVSALSSPREK